MKPKAMWHAVPALAVWMSALALFLVGQTNPRLGVLRRAALGAAIAATVFTVVEDQKAFRG